MSRSVRTDYEALREQQARVQECLVVYEKHPDADAYRVGAGFTGYSILARDKRFATAELLAQYWFGQAMGGDQVFAAALWRAAARPHYDE